ncbi:hypothetical protein LINGRAHAP2_LOCUS33144 [Linum grandiflorum]
MLGTRLVKPTAYMTSQSIFGSAISATTNRISRGSHLLLH